MQKSSSFHEFYPIEPPFSFVAIKFEGGSYIYEVIEPELNEKEKEALKKLKYAIYEEVDFSSIEGDLEKSLEEIILKFIKRFKIKLEDFQIKKITYYLKRDFLDYGAITVLIKDPNVEDISCDGINTPVYVFHKRYENIPTNIIFTDLNELTNLVLRLAYKGNTQITSARPIVDAVLPEGYRAHLTLSDVSKRGPTFTIRKFFVKPITIIELIQNKVITPKAAAYLWVLIENLKAILVIGATGAGKTTTLNAIATFIPPDAKIVTIEETREINIPHKNWNPMVTRVTTQGGIQEVTMFDLLKASLRQRPNYIIVGEIRGEEAFTLAQAIATGHGGLTTFHAENAEYAIYRLLHKPLDVPKVLLSMISTIVKIERVKIGNLSFRKITQIVEVLGYDEKLDKPILNEVYSWNYNDNSDIDLMKSQHLMEITKMGKYQNVLDEINTRAMILEWMAKKNLKDFKVVGEIISTYYIDPKRVTLLALTNSEWTVK